jgi:hypothetical protein
MSGRPLRDTGELRPESAAKWTLLTHPYLIELFTEHAIIQGTLLTPIWTLLTRLGVIPRTLLTNLIT